MTHSNTHVHFRWRHRTHTHTHTQAEVAVNFSSAFFPSRTVLPPGPQEQWAAFRRPGTKSSDPSWSGTDSSVLLHVFLLGFLVEETPCEHGENMQTPHRKAREIAHLSTVHSGEDLPPRANSAPCGNRTHDLLAVRRQCKHLSHRATNGSEVAHSSTKKHRKHSSLKIHLLSKIIKH